MAVVSDSLVRSSYVLDHSAVGSVIRVFLGCAPNGEDAESCCTLEYSLRKHASQPVDITWMALSRDPVSPFHGWQTEWWSTPFTPFRLLVPWLCGFEGRAIYMDSDFLVMSDIAELWGQEFAPGKVVMAKGEGNQKRLCISLWDCAAAKPFLPSVRYTYAADYRRALLGLSDAVQAFRGAWNVIDGEGYSDLRNPDIKAIHYSCESTQPHLWHAIPRLKAAGLKHWFDGEMRDHWRHDLIRLFDELYTDALSAGYTLDRYIPTQPYGDYQISSHEHYREHRWARA